MRMPGFEAEASLSKGSLWRTADSRNYAAVGKSIVQRAASWLYPELRTDL